MSEGDGPVRRRIALWTAVAQFTALIAGVTATLLNPPPQLYDLEEDQFAGASSKAIAIGLFLLILVIARKFDSRARLNRLSIGAFALFVCAFVSIFFYAMTVRDWSCRYPGENGSLFVRGAQYTAQAEQKRIDFNFDDDCGKVMFAYGPFEVGKVWDQAEMKGRYYTLLVWFLLNSAAMISALMLAIEAAQRVIIQPKD
jgi:energy-coupling factor transporter transmembrane protein EcfT